jgi:hypothetical protein
MAACSRRLTNARRLVLRDAAFEADCLAITVVVVPTHVGYT